MKRWQSSGHSRHLQAVAAEAIAANFAAGCGDGGDAEGCLGPDADRRAPW